MHVAGIVCISIAAVSLLAGLHMLSVLFCRPCKKLAIYAHGRFLRGVVVLFMTGEVCLVGGMALLIVANGALDGNKKDE